MRKPCPTNKICLHFPSAPWRYKKRRKGHHEQTPQTLIQRAGRTHTGFPAIVGSKANVGTFWYCRNCSNRAFQATRHFLFLNSFKHSTLPEKQCSPMSTQYPPDSCSSCSSLFPFLSIRRRFQNACIVQSERTLGSSQTDTPVPFQSNLWCTSLPPTAAKSKEVLRSFSKVCVCSRFQKINK